MNRRDNRAHLEWVEGIRQRQLEQAQHINRHAAAPPKPRRRRFWWLGFFRAKA